MKRLFVTAALLPLALASAARAESHISGGTSTPVKTSTAASGAPDNLTIDAGGSVTPTVAGPAVTLDSDNTVTNLGSITFNDVDGATGILALGGHTGSVINSASISVTEDIAQPDTDADGYPDGPAAVGSTRYGIRVTGPGALTGDVRNDATGGIVVKGNDSAGISVETQLNGNLLSAGAVTVTGDRSTGISAQHVTGDVRITGAVAVTGAASRGVVLGDVDGVVQLQNVITATGYKTVTRLADDARAKLDADDLAQGGAAVSITGSVAKGVLLDRPPVLDPNNPDVDGDGVADTSESTAVITSFGAAPALDIGSDHATTIGMVGTGENAYGLVNKGTISGQGINDGVGATGLRIGLPGGGVTTIVGGVNNIGGTITATAYGADVKANGGDATALLINPNAVVPAVVNSGTIAATLTGGSQDAYAIVDKSGTVGLVDNIGTISAGATAATGSTNLGRTVAIDVSANTTGVLVRQAAPVSTFIPAITGDILFGSGADTLQVSGGTVTGAISFGAGADSLLVDGGGAVSGAITDSDGQLTVQVLDGRLAISNAATLQMTSLAVGAKGVLAFNLDPAAGTNTRLVVAGPATLADGATVEVTLASMLKTETVFQLISAATLQQGATGTTLVGAPYMFTASLQAAPTSLSVDVRPKTAAELGLNRSGAQAYPAVFANLDRDPALQNAFLAQTTQSGFQSLYDQMLPDHSGGSLMSAQAISSAISQAVGQALPHDGAGGSAMWAQEIAFHLDRDRDQALGYTAQGYGLAAGGEVVGDNNAIGLDGSFVTTTYNDKGAAVGERIVMNFAEGGVYWRIRTGGFQADARAGLGYVWFDSDRRLASTTLAYSATARWSGWLADAHAGASYTARLGAFYARPELSLDYIRLNEGGYQETGGGPGFDLQVDGRNGDLLTGQALMALGWQFGDANWWAPELKLGWQQILSGAPGLTTAQYAGGTPFTLSPETPAAGGLVARFGFKTGGDQLFVAVDGGGTFDKSSRSYDMRATVRFRF
jgi:outer membrane autotransporter protein